MNKSIDPEKNGRIGVGFKNLINNINCLGQILPDFYVLNTEEEGGIVGANGVTLNALVKTI